MHVEIWSDIACPFCAIGKRRFDVALGAFAHREDVTVTWRSFELQPEFPGAVEDTLAGHLAKTKGLRADDVQRMMARTTAMAKGDGIDMHFEKVRVADTRRAHELLHLAAAHGRAEAMMARLFDAYFTTGDAINDPEVLVRLAQEVGLEASAAREALDRGLYRQAVLDDEHEAAQLGIHAVPYFVFDRRYGVAGAQSAAAFTQALERAWTDAHPEQELVAAGDSAANELCGPDGCEL
jgi:predicted DsbA family dithiol-disulfide isomerase